jgi:hypothetical protein
VAGTARQSVSDDYEQRLAEGRRLAQLGIAKSLERLAYTNRHEVSVTSEHGRVELARDVVGDEDVEEMKEQQLKVVFCDGDPAGAQLNISMCAFTSAKNLTRFDVLAWNPLGHTVDTLLRVPVSGDDGWQAKLGDESLEMQLVALDALSLSLSGLYVNSFGLNEEALVAEKAKFTNEATHVMFIRVQLPPVGYAAVQVSRSGSSIKAAVDAHKQHDANRASERSVERSVEKPDTVVENDMFKVQFEPETGALASVLNKASGVQIDMDISWGYYVGSRGGCTKEGVVAPAPDCDIQTSGAYIFRPNVTTLFPPRDDDNYAFVESNAKLIIENEIIRGELVIEVRQRVAQWASHVIRLVAGQPFIEVEWTAGPIPRHVFHQEGKLNENEDESGKELVIKYSTSVRNDGVFETDSNGLEMLSRRVNKRDPGFGGLLVNEVVAGNYYPVNSIISVEDQNAQVVVVTDRTQGGTSRGQGELELMVHRRLLVDDGRG